MNARLLLVVLAAVAAVSPFAQTRTRGSVACYPWVFVEGTDTSRKSAADTVHEIAMAKGYALLPADVAAATWQRLKLPAPSAKDRPNPADLAKFAKAMKADEVLFGMVSWHTRSIWVGAGPKTISTAKVDAMVFDAKTGKIAYKKEDVTGRSDEKESSLKVVGAVLVTPLITAVSGGPATPREQRAVQIALARALADWAKG